MENTGHVKRLAPEWTDAEIATLRELLGTMTAGQIGERIGRNKSGVLKKVRRLGLQNRQYDKSEKWPDPLIESLKTRGPNMTARDFMKEYGLTKDSVYNHAKKFKIKFKLDVFWTPEKIEFVRQSKSAASVSRILGIGKDSVLRIAKRSGIILEETRVHTEPKQATQRTREAQKRVPTKTATYRRSGREERSRIEYCPVCHSPVSDWQGHFERQGHRRPVA